MRLLSRYDDDVKSIQLCLLVATVTSFPMFQTLAAPEITFELLASFDYPEAVSTYATGVNDDNVVAAVFANSSGKVRGFVRDGVHLSGPIIHPEDRDGFTEVRDLNNDGILCGYYQGRNGNLHGFLLSGATYTAVDVGVRETRLNGINDAGNICGSIDDRTSAFIIVGGTTTNFDIAGATLIDSLGINNMNQSVGYYGGPGPDYYGFFRDSGGALTYPIMASAASSTFLFGINDKRWMVGYFNDFAGSHGVLFLSPNKHVTYDYPGADATAFFGVNNQGVIVGSYTDGGGTHGLIVRARRATDN